MAVRVSDLFPIDELRYEPTERRVRGELGGETVVDSHDAWLVWDPGRLVPGWCFPREDVRTDLVGAVGTRAYDDPDLAGRVAIPFAALDRWLEEEVEVIGHPRDPFKRVDVRRSSRHVRVTVGGQILADSARPLLLFETGLPVRYYLLPEDVRLDLMRRTATHTLCAYKGRASYYSAPGAEDVAWFYPDPLRENAEIRDHIAFFNERVDLDVDGRRLERPVSPWS
jgi:uncharacterized protein (DUF427 family)